MIKISINKILWHVVRFECLVGIEILKYEFWPFLQKPGKKCKTAITFTRSTIHRFLKFEKKKSYFKHTIFFLQNQKFKKKLKKEKNSKIQKFQKKVITKKIVEIFGFFEFFGFFKVFFLNQVFWIFWVFWIF